MKALRHYQEKAAEKVYQFFYSEEKKGKLYISTGLGKTAIVVSSIEKILAEPCNRTIAILAARHEGCEQIKSAMAEKLADISLAESVKEFIDAPILITTYQDVLNHHSNLKALDFVICDDAQFVKYEDCFELPARKDTKYLGLLPAPEAQDNWFHDAICLYSYTVKDARKDGYLSYTGEYEFTQQFLMELLKDQGYQNIFTEVAFDNGNGGKIRVDILAEQDNRTVVIEVKSYRNYSNAKTVIDLALNQIIKYREIILRKKEDKEYSFVIVLPCEVESSLKKEVYNQFGVIIWDINNLIYLCEQNKSLLQLLNRYIPYPFLGLKGEKPLGMKDEKKAVVIEEDHPSLSETYIKRLEACRPGKLEGADKQYEAICTEIIKYLFGTEFFRMSEQHKTEDEMFRMDLLCSLKGTTEFWKFLITFYRTKFVVFEYKNYSDYISQNLIYLTEKYLFPVALRNVAFIISRKGFGTNAEKAALGCLRENGKLIVSLNDDDLIQMLTMKENGEEPSDYLLDRVERLLMSVGK